MTDPTTPDLGALTEIVKRCAVQELLPRFGRIRQQLKADGSIVTEADRAMQSALQSALHTHWPQIGFLGEEMPAAAQERVLRESADGVWIVDPLDGTSNFSEGIAFFAVSIALIRDARVVLGLVYDPLRDECFTAQLGHGARLNQTGLSLASYRDLDVITIGLVDFKRLPTALAVKLVSQAPYKSQRSFGSVALDWCWIAAGRGDVYVHGKQKLWDFAAGQLILAEAGGYAATLQGTPVFDGSLSARSAVLAVNKKLFDVWLTYLQDLS